MHPVIPDKIFVNWFFLVPKEELVKAGNDKEARLVQPANILTQALPAVIVVKELKLTLIKPVQFENIP